MTQLQAARAEELSSGFKGEVLLPGDDAYESARQIWNAMVDKRPAVIARCAAVSDVVRAVNFARDNGLLLAVRGGGHNIAGSALCDDGLRLLSPPRERGSGLHLPHRGSGCHTRTSYYPQEIIPAIRQNRAAGLPDIENSRPDDR